MALLLETSTPNSILQVVSIVLAFINLGAFIFFAGAFWQKVQTHDAQIAALGAEITKVDEIGQLKTTMQNLVDEFRYLRNKFDSFSQKHVHGD